MEKFVALFLFICGVPIIYMMAKANVDGHFRLKEQFKERGLEWCLAELAIARSSEYKLALKGAIADLHES